MLDKALCFKFYQSGAYAWSHARWNCEFYRSQGSIWPMLGSTTSRKDLIWVKPTALGITLH